MNWVLTMMVASFGLNMISSMPCLEIPLCHFLFICIGLLMHFVLGIDIGFRRTKKFLRESIIVGTLIGVLDFIIQRFIFYKPRVFATYYSLIWYIFQMWFLIGFAEEIMFRGVIQTELMKTLPQDVKILGLNFKRGTLLAAIIFGLAHTINIFTIANVYFVIGQVISAIIFGLIVGYFYQETGSLIPAIIIHNLANGIASLAYVL